MFHPFNCIYMRNGNLLSSQAKSFMFLLQIWVLQAGAYHQSISHHFVVDLQCLSQCGKSHIILIIVAFHYRHFSILVHSTYPWKEIRFTTDISKSETLLNKHWHTDIRPCKYCCFINAGRIATAVHTLLIQSFIVLGLFTMEGASLSPGNGLR